MHKLATVAIAISLMAIAACATTKGYHICNDFDANMNCPDNTANVVIEK